MRMYNSTEMIGYRFVLGLSSGINYFDFKDVYETISFEDILLRKEKNFDFRYPLLVFIASVAFLIAMCCPSYYAMVAIGAGRLVNLIYFAI